MRPTKRELLDEHKRLIQENNHLRATAAEAERDELAAVAEQQVGKVRELAAALDAARGVGAEMMRDLIVEILNNSASSAVEHGGWGVQAGKFIQAKADFIRGISGVEATAAPAPVSGGQDPAP